MTTISVILCRRFRLVFLYDCRLFLLHRLAFLQVARDVFHRTAKNKRRDIPHQTPCHRQYIFSKLPHLTIILYAHKVYPHLTNFIHQLHKFLENYQIWKCLLLEIALVCRSSISCRFSYICRNRRYQITSCVNVV